MNSVKARRIREALNTAIAAAMHEFGDTTIVLGNARYDESSIRFSNLTITEGNAEEAAEKLWKKHCHKFVLDENDFGAEVKIQDKFYTVVGLNPRAKKSPVILEGAAGKKFKAPASLVKAAMIGLILLLTACGYAQPRPSNVGTVCRTYSSEYTPAHLPDSTTVCKEYQNG